jgi:hypothetical protein
VRSLFERTTTDCAPAVWELFWKSPSWEGRKLKVSGWVFMTKKPPRRCATAVAARHSSQEGIFRRPAIQVQNSGTILAALH